jgi:hypothetical protein
MECDGASMGYRFPTFRRKRNKPSDNASHPKTPGPSAYIGALNSTRERERAVTVT